MLSISLNVWIQWNIIKYNTIGLFKKVLGLHRHRHPLKELDSKEKEQHCLFLNLHHEAPS